MMMSAPIVILAPGQPVALGRPRSQVITDRKGQPVKSANGHFVVKHYTPDKSHDYQSQVRWLAKGAMRGRKPLEGPLRLFLDMRFRLLLSKSQRWQRAALAGEIRPVARPDASNVLKGIEDALNGICWIDDSQIVSGSWEKRYALEPCVVITIEPIAQAEQLELSDAPPLQRSQAPQPMATDEGLPF